MKDAFDAVNRLIEKFVSQDATEQQADITNAIESADSSALVDWLATLKEGKEEIAKVFDFETNRLETELMSRGLRHLEDKKIKHTTFKGNRASITVGMTRSLKVHNADNLRKIVSERWHDEIKTKDPTHSVAADFGRALTSLYLGDYISEMTLQDLLAKGVTIKGNASNGDSGVSDGGKLTVIFNKDSINLLIKKLKGDYDKDKELFEGVLGVALESEIDEELYFISQIKNWERIRKYFSQDEAMQVKRDIKNGIFVSEAVRLTMRQ